MYEFTILFSKGKVKGQMVQFVFIHCHFLTNYTQLKSTIKYKILSMKDEQIKSQNTVNLPMNFEEPCSQFQLIRKSLSNNVLGSSMHIRNWFLRRRWVSCTYDLLIINKTANVRSCIRLHICILDIFLKGRWSKINLLVKRCDNTYKPEI